MSTGYDSGGEMLKLVIGVGCIGYGFFTMNLVIVGIGVAALAWMAFGD